MADFSITGEVRLNSDPAEKSTSKWTVAAGQMIADFAKQASSKLAEVVKSGVDYNATMESYLTNFKVMLGSEEDAATKLSEIRKMAASTPFSLDDLTSGTQTLLQFGIAADDTTGVLQRLGDISLGNAEKLQTLTRAYGKMSSAQKVTLENVNMMIDAGFNPLNQICDATGESMSDLYKRISDGKVSFSELEEAVEAATSQGGQFYNGMLEASQTFSGRMSTLTDNTKALLGALSDSFYSSLSDLLPVANDVVLELTDAFTEGGVPAMLDTAAELLDNFADGLIQKIPDAVSAVSDLLTELLNYLADHQDDIFDSGVQLLENLIIGITDSLPNLITSAANLIARFAAALIAHLPDILKCGAAMLTTLVDGIVRSLENLAEAALACVAKLVGVWDGSMDEWGHIGENIVSGLLNGIKGAWNSLTKWVSDGINGLVSGVKGLLGIHSPSKVFSEIGLNVCQGLANGITENAGLAEDAAQQMAGAVAETAKESVAATLDELWTQLQEQANTGALGTISSLCKAVKQQDWAGVGKWAAAALYRGLNADQKQQLQSFGLGLIDQLNTTLQGAESKLASAAWDIGTNIYKGITSGFPEVLSRTKDLCSTIKGVFAALKGPLSTLAASISSGLSTGLLSQIPTILGAMGGLIASIGGAFTAMLESIGATLTACGIPTGPLMVAAGVALVATIAAIVASLAGGSHGGGSGSHGSSGGSSGSAGGITGDIDVPADKLEEAILSNTKALEKTNSALADMIRQAGALVLSDNMRLGSTVAASGTAQVVSAARSYHREGDTNITQNIYSKAQTAADLQREARWEADRAKAQRR